MLDTIADAIHLEQFLLVADLQRQMGADRIHQAAGILDPGQRIQYLVGHLLRHLDVLLELVEQHPHQRLLLTLAQGLAGTQYHLGRGVTLFGYRDLTDIGARLALDQHLDGTVREFQQLHDLGYRADGEQIFVIGIILARLTLGDQQDPLVIRHGGFQRLNRLLSADKQGDDHLRVYHHVTQWQKGQTHSLFGVLLHRRRSSNLAGET